MGCASSRGIAVNSLRQRQNGCHFPDDIFKYKFLNEIVWISLKIWLKFVPEVRINNIPSLVQIMAWLILVNGSWGISFESALRWMLLDLKLTDDKSILVQVMAWCRQATSHYLSQCWPRSMSQYGVTRPQWVNSLWPGAPFTNMDKL